MSNEDKLRLTGMSLASILGFILTVDFYTLLGNLGVLIIPIPISILASVICNRCIRHGRGYSSAEYIEDTYTRIVAKINRLEKQSKTDDVSKEIFILTKLAVELNSALDQYRPTAERDSP